MTDRGKKKPERPDGSTNVRAISLGCLLRILEQGEYSHVVLREELEKYSHLEKRDRAFLTRLTEGVVERLYELDYTINWFSKIKTEKMKPVIREILRMGVYQILYMDAVPDSAACNEAVKLAQKKGFGNLKGFVNGVLRAASRGMEEVMLPDKNLDFPAYAAVKYSTPVWITKKLVKEYGEERAEGILAAGLSERPLTVRCNLSRISWETAKNSLEEQGIRAETIDGIPGALEIYDFDMLPKVDAFSKGFLQVQDVSSMLAGMAAAPKEGDFVLDVCSAPGGKSLHAADLLHGTGHVEARDLTAEKVRLIEENIGRSSLTNLSARVWDALVLDKDKIASADVVIADLPCSGLGIIGRKSDIKYKMTEDAQKELVMLQRRILDVVWQYVKPGGRLVYSTCTVFSSENAENADWFTENYPFYTESLEEVLPKRFFTETTGQGKLQLLPGEKGTDGFFIARFRRKESIHR
ncbi:16S rRNA (cytosine(967)-C(5))-methyltransferase RsmB [Lacrimispora sp. NSJ-141]|uniref:16S rRNA (cytosine(967)-C(5))-methyltransferase n=1 Tax=Lientehia hominis TaxID=2897778 RepID=A0AAP2RIJ5_9FIRM|nr:16S rRNA (cytosine(967)-C(5))-methyltransferase RsmB [Lientehia hominis]